MNEGCVFLYKIEQPPAKNASDWHVLVVLDLAQTRLMACSSRASQILFQCKMKC
jgi:hypothetical protein